MANLFGEAGGRVVVSVAPAVVERVLDAARAAGVPAARLGETGGETLALTVAPLGALSVPVEQVRRAREACLDGIVGSG